MNPHRSRPLIPAAIASTLAALALAYAGCSGDDPVKSYSGGYTSTAGATDDDNPTVSYDYTLAGPHSVTITPEKLTASPGEVISVDITVKNVGTEAFYLPKILSERVKLLSHYRDKNDQTPDVITDDPPANLPMLKCRPVAPGDSVSAKVKFTVGGTPGRLILFTNVSRPDEEVELNVN